MNTTVATQEQATAKPATASGPPLAEFQQPRLPYHPLIEQRFGIDRSGWKALVEAVFPAARSVDSIIMALSYCRARGLDPFKRPVHIVPMWDSKSRSYVETVWPGISEVRTTAFRTGQYAGCDEAAFGPDVEETFSGRVKAGKDKWEDREVTICFPEWCRVTVYRLVGGHRVSFVGPKVYWRETYAKIGASDLPNDMWAKRSRGQIEKCAEAAALRKAFPEEIGNTPTAEEMEGQRLIVDHEASVVEQVQEQPERSKPETTVVQPAANGERKELPPLVGQPNDPYEAEHPAETTDNGKEVVPDQRDNPHATRPAADDPATEQPPVETGDLLGGNQPQDGGNAGETGGDRPERESAEEQPQDTASEQPADDAGEMPDPDKVLDDLEAQLSTASTKDMIDEIYITLIDPLIDEDKLFPPDKQRAVDMYKKHIKRVQG